MESTDYSQARVRASLFETIQACFVGDSTTLEVVLLLVSHLDNPTSSLLVDRHLHLSFFLSENCLVSLQQNSSVRISIEHISNDN